MPDLDQIWVPVGGGGLAAGTVVAAAGISPDVSVVAAEPEGADDADPEPSSRKRKGRKKQRSGDTVAARSAGLEQPGADQPGAEQTAAAPCLTNIARSAVLYLWWRAR